MEHLILQLLFVVSPKKNDTDKKSMVRRKSMGLEWLK